MLNRLRTSQRLTSLIIVILLVVISFGVLNAKRPTTPYYFDEVSWICEGRVWNALINLDFKSGVWVEDLVQRLNPQLGKYVLGWWMNTTYGEKGFDIYNCPSWGSLMHISSMDSLSAPQQQVLVTMRIPMMLFGVATVFTLFLIATYLFNPVVGIISATLLLFHPIFITTVNRAMPDSLLLFWFTAFLALIIYLVKKQPRFFLNFQFFTSIFCGILLGIGISIKTYGVYALGFIILVSGTFYVMTQFHQKKFTLKPLISFLLNMFIIALAAVLVVFLLNPTFWYTPQKLLTWIPEWQTFQYWLQTDDWAYKDSALFTPVSRIKFFFQNILQTGNWLFDLISGTAFCFGIVVSLRRFARRNEFLWLLPLTWFASLFLILLLYTPFQLERYFTPLLPAFALVSAISLSSHLIWISGFLQRKRRPS